LCCCYTTRRKKDWGLFGPPEGWPTKTILHEAEMCTRVVHLASSTWKVHNNPRAAIPACANKLDNMEPLGGWHRRPGDLL
jgi:hypothetical protein